MPDPKEQVMLFVENVLTSAQVKALVATDVSLIAAPGVGKIIVPLFHVLTLKFATIAYTWANTDHSITVGGAVTDSDAEAQALIESADRHSIVLRPAVDSAELAENTALFIGATGTGEPAAGDSTLLVKTYYTIINVTK